MLCDLVTYKLPWISNYIHVMDLADAHIKALEYLKKGGESDVFNLGNGMGFSVRDVIETSETVTGRKIKVKETERRPGDPPVLVGSSSKAQKILDWQPSHQDLASIIKTAWKWHQKII